jgi:hypothetical protein
VPETGKSRLKLHLRVRHTGSPQMARNRHVAFHRTFNLCVQHARSPRKETVISPHVCASGTRSAERTFVRPACTISACCRGAPESRAISAEGGPQDIFALRYTFVHPTEVTHTQSPQGATFRWTRPGCPCRRREKLKEL